MIYRKTKELDIGHNLFIDNELITIISPRNKERLGGQDYIDINLRFLKQPLTLTHKGLEYSLTHNKIDVFYNYVELFGTWELI